MYAGKEFIGRIINGMLEIDGIEGSYKSFSAASQAVTQTSRNGWLDWQIQTGDGWLLADEWRKEDS